MKSAARLFYFLIAALMLLSACVRPGSSLDSAIPEPPGPTKTHPIPPSPIPSATFTPLPSPTPVPIVRIHTAEQALLNGDWENALAEFQLAFDTTSDSQVAAEALLGSARSHLMASNVDEAIAILKGMIANQPAPSQITAADSAAHFYLAQAYSLQELHAEAAQEYLNYLTSNPGVIDAYILNLRGDALLAAGDFARAAVDFKAALGAQSVLDEIDLRLKLARSFALDGDHLAALSEYDEISTLTANEYTRALVNLRKGQSYLELGQVDDAQAVFLDAVNQYPKSYDTYSALVALVEAGITVDELQRGVIDYHAGQYGPAMAAFDHYLQHEPADPVTALYYYGLTARAQGNYADAVSHWDELIETYAETSYADHLLWDDAWEQKAYTQWAYLSEYPQAIQTLTAFVDLSPGQPRAAEFLFDAAQIAEMDDQLNLARELWDRQASAYPNDERTARSRFLSALAQYRLGDYPAAKDAFERFEAVAVTLEDKASARFWVAKSLAAAGDSEAALAAWQAAAAIDPTGYYSERARDILHDRMIFQPPISYDLAFDLPAERLKAEEWVKTTFNLPEDSSLAAGLAAPPPDLLADPYFQRGLQLWKLGLYDEARGELEILRQYSQGDPGRTFQLIQIFLDLGAYRPAIMAARQVLDLAALTDSSTLSAPIYFNHVRFGTYYSDLLIPLAQQYGFHPLFLYALIRQESLFEGFVNSSAGARGLMQIIPATGEEIAANLGWPENYSSSDLIRPIVNLTLGVDYLNRQYEQFDGDLYAALAAYNAGPGNALAWKQLVSDDPDLFLEIIRFAETRDYIRHIYENFSIYRLIYDRTP